MLGMIKPLYDYIRKDYASNSVQHHQHMLTAHTGLSGVPGERHAPALSAVCVQLGPDFFVPEVELPPYICDKCNKSIDMNDKEIITYHHSGRCTPKRFALKKDDDQKLQNLVDLKMKEIKRLSHIEYIKHLSQHLIKQAESIEADSLADIIKKRNSEEIYKALDLAKAFRIVAKEFTYNPPPER